MQTDLGSVELTDEQYAQVNTNQSAQARRIMTGLNEDGTTRFEGGSELGSCGEFMAASNQAGAASLKQYKPMVWEAAVEWSAGYDGTNEDELMDGCLNELCFEGMGAMFGVKDTEARTQVKHMVESVWGRTKIGDPQGARLGVTDISNAVDKAYLGRQNAAAGIMAALGKKDGKWDVLDKRALKGNGDLRNLFCGRDVPGVLAERGLAWLQEVDPDDYAEVMEAKGKGEREYQKRLDEAFDDHAAQFATAMAPELDEMARQYEATWKRVANFELAYRLGGAASLQPGQELDFNEECRIRNAVLYGQDGGTDSPYDDRFNAGRWMVPQSEQEAEGRYRGGVKARHDEAGNADRLEKLGQFQREHAPAPKEEKPKAERKAAEPKKPKDSTAREFDGWRYMPMDDGSPRGGAVISKKRYAALQEELGLQDGDQLLVKVKSGSGYKTFPVKGSYEPEDGASEYGILLNAAASRQVMKRGAHLREDSGGDADVQYVVKRKL